MSAQVTLPQGSVDNEGHLIADAGSIIAQAQTVNNRGLIQADSVQNNNGVIELVASDSVNLGANSVISAQGDSTGISPGGSVIIKSGDTFSDQAGSAISVAGGTQGGNGGDVEVCAPQMSSIQSVVHGQAAAGFAGGVVTIDPANIWLASTATDPSAPANYTVINVNSYSGLSQINVLADNNIILNTLWTLAGVSTPATLNLTATAGNITFNAGSGIIAPENAQNNWSINLSAGNTITLNAGTTIQADAGRISLNAATVDLYGTLQANSIGQANGVIDVNASGNLTLESGSDIEVHGDNTSASASPGGFVTLQAGSAYSDTASSIIDVAGSTGAGGGQAGVVEIFGSNLNGNGNPTGVNSSFVNVNSVSYTPTALLINPYDITLSQNTTGATADANYSNFEDANFNLGDLAAYTQIDLHALDNIELSAPWTLYAKPTPASFSLQAGNSIILDDGASISAVLFDANYNPAANNFWAVNLTAGTGFTPTAAQPTPPPGGNGTGVYSYGIYLNGSAYVQTENGDINVWAANEVQINAEPVSAGNNGIRTLAGGNIAVTTQYGDVNTGGNAQGFTYNKTPGSYGNFYTPSTSLGGISTAAGGNVTISAGGNVISFLPTGSDTGDAGTGAFGPEPGNVNITAGGSVYGHYVLAGPANSVGFITSETGDIGMPSGSEGFALSLVDGSWTVSAPNGNIYLQEVRNPNGVLNDVNNNKRNQPPDPAGQHLFDYGADASVSLDAGNGVYLTDLNLPRPNGEDVPVLYPPILDISAGSGGVNLEGNVTLYPSPDQSLTITTTQGGNLYTDPALGVELLMSDSGQNRWVQGQSTFSDSDHGPLSAEPTASTTPVTVYIAGDMENLTLITTKETQITVGGDMVNCGFSGQNLKASDTSFIKVTGQIYNQSAYTYVDGVTIPNVPSQNLPLGLSSAWDSIFLLALNPAAIASLTVPANTPQSQLLGFALQSASLFGVTSQSGQLLSTGDQGFHYDATTGRLWFGGAMSPTLFSDLSSDKFTVLQLDNGVPVLDANGHFETTTISWVPAAAIQTLYTASQSDPNPLTPAIGYRLGGPGTFDVTAGSISLGNTYGILSCGVEDPQDSLNRYNNLASITPASANLNVTVTGPDQTGTVVEDGVTIMPHASLDMLTSTIATLGGGNLDVNSQLGSMDLGIQNLFNISRFVGLGVYSAAGGDVTVTAPGNINIDGSRIATYDGGTVTVDSSGGNVSVGSGGDTQTGVYMSYVAGGEVGYYQEFVYGSGIVANTLVPSTAAVLLGGHYVGYPPSNASITAAALPGNITVTAEGNITASLGGITQEALGRSTGSGPTINLSAGGNIDLGESGVIGGSVNVTAKGNIKGLIISRQNSDVKAQGNFSGSVLAGGSADVSGGGTVSGTIVGVGGATVSGASVTAQVLSQNANVNGQVAQSTLGSSAGATSASASAAVESSAEAKQEVATTGNGDDDERKKHRFQPLMQKTKRVTVVLPKI